MRQRARALSAPPALALLAILTACAPLPAPAPSSPPPALAASASAYQLPAASAAWYRDAAAGGATVLAIDPQRSLIVVTVRRGGALARLGHDHVVASHQLAGLAAPTLGRADLGFRLDQLVVDEAALRAEAQLDTQPSLDAIDGTRRNMLTKVLQADAFPEVHLQVNGAPMALATSPSSRTLQLSITLHGVTHVLPVQAEVQAEVQSIAASGTLILRQSDFGIVPMSIMNGAMTVQDALELRFTIVAAAPSR